jgi:hypothetical protein
MWEGVNPSTHSKDNLKWIAEGMANGTLIWTTDGSYDRKKAANLSNNFLFTNRHAHIRELLGMIATS